MKQPITMHCNESQFNEVKEKLKGKVNLTMLSEFNSNERFYLINHLCEEQNTVTNVVNPIRREGVIFYEEWNEKIFLEACGIETEKTFSITESQIKYILRNLNSHAQPQFKKFIPEAFESEVKLEVGKWYKSWNGVLKFWVTNDSCYGFNSKGIWSDIKSGDFDLNGTIKTYNWTEATEQEVFEAIEKEINRRYKVGDYLKNHQGTWKLKNLNLANRLFANRICENIGIYNKQELGKWLLLDGKWADVIESITLSEAEQKLGKKIIV